MNRYFLAVLCIAFIYVSCKDKKEEPDTTKPVITLHSPSQDQNFATGDTIVFSASITDNEELHEIHIHVHNETTDEHIVEQEIHADAASYPYTFSYVVVETDSTEFHFEVTATDHNESSSFAEIECTANF